MDLPTNAGVGFWPKADGVLAKRQASSGRMIPMMRRLYLPLTHPS